MKSSSRKILICGLMAVIATTNMGSFAQSAYQKEQKRTTVVPVTVTTPTTPTTPVKPPVEVIPNTPGTVFIDGVKDFKVTFNEKMEVTSISQWDQPTLQFEALKGKSLSAVLTELKSSIVAPENTEIAKFPVMIGMGADLKNNKQVKAIEAELALLLKNQSALTMNLDELSTEKVKTVGTSYLSTLYQTHVESLINIKGLTKEQYEAVLKSEKFMSLVGAEHEGIAYKKAADSQFDATVGTPVKPVKPSNDKDKDDDDDDEDDDDDDDEDDDEDDDDDDDDDEEDEE